MNDEKFYITTPIYYVNDKPHIGHAYTTVAADVLARFFRDRSVDTFFLTGTDEHGAKIAQAAEKLGKTPKEFTDEISAKFSFAWDQLGIEPNRFIRTTEEEHIKAVQKALQYMYEKGDIYLGKYEGLYCIGHEAFITEKELVDGKCPDHKTVPEKMSEETYMFRLSKYQEELRKKVESDEFKILPAVRKNEILSFYKEGLEDVSFSRKNVKWGISIPWDNSHTVYVWADAFLNYLTGLNWQGSNDRIPEFWPADFQLMSKDILRVHATIWPAMLLSLGITLPKILFVHGYFTIDGQKMSKTVGNVIDPNDWVAKFGADAVRYFLLREVPFGQDGDVSEEKLKARYESDLANGLGNLVSRVTTLIEKNLDGKVPPDGEFPFDPDEVDQLVAEYKFHEALAKVWEWVAWANKKVDEKKLWELAEKNKADFTKTCADLLAAIDFISLKLTPFIPETAKKIQDSINSKKITKVQPLFPRIP